ncbi:PA14 domain-containing protein [Stigmatella hybrida]|uniref:PA14 domain-containing protein n=1 Tax=Stigmatella hybrida TaxID=394097 RepID=UPI001CDAD680|nr:PA14 domain-containing protein [Stigmatella hybrida]
MIHRARARRYTLAQMCLVIPILLTLACQGGETGAQADTGTAERAVTAQLTVSLIDEGGFNYPWQVNDDDSSSGAWGAGDLAFVGYDLGSLKQVQEVRSYGDQAYGFAVQLFDANWSQTGWYDCNIDGSKIQWQACNIPDTHARYVYVRYRTHTSGSWVQELDIYGDAAGSGLAIPSGAFRGTYFSDKNLTVQAFQRQDAAINFNWGTGSPGTGAGADNFSVRWEGDWNFSKAGTYRFSTTSDDGSRIYVDGNLVVNHWSDHGATALTGDVQLTAGTHRVKVEYYDAGGSASVNVSWLLLTGGSPGAGGVPSPPSGWVLDLDDNFDSLDWNKWKQWQTNVPLIHTVMYMNTQSHCVTVNGYLEMRARKRNDGSGIWDGCYLDQGTWWDSNANKPAHPGYADYQVSFKANLPPGLGTGMYFLMWPIAESWGGTPWPPELDIVELPFNDGDDIMTTWHWDPDNKQSEIRPAVDRRNGKQWVYTARRTGNTIRMWVGDPSTNTINEIPLPAAFSNNPDYKRMLVGMANFIASTWAINGSASAFWYGDANSTGSTAWTAYIDYVKVWKPGPGMSGQ